MDDPSPIRSAPPSLKAALRRARIEEADRADVVAELRGAEIVRLEMLQNAIQPVLAQVPEDVDLFDVGLALGERPRLFVDMIGFVEMGRDRRLYRFAQNMRHGRVVIAETENIAVMVEAVANYIARRMVEREKALASDEFFRARGTPAPASVAPDRSIQTREASAPQNKARDLKARDLKGKDLTAAGSVGARAPVATAPPGRTAEDEPGVWRRTGAAIFEFLRSVFLIIIVAVLIWFAWRFANAWWTHAPNPLGAP